MSESYLLLRGGTIYDPANGIDGEVADLWIRGGRIVAAPSHEDATTVTINVSGYVIMPGGVDMHCHIVGPKVNAARKMLAGGGEFQPLAATDQTRGGSWGPVPSTFVTGYRYLGLGYTTAFDAAVSPLTARHAHEQLNDTPCIDKGFYLLAGNNRYVMQTIEAGDQSQLDNYLAWLLGATRGYAIKLVNPGGVVAWNHIDSGFVQGLDDTLPNFQITPRSIIREVALAADRMGLPHAPHVHCNQLGIPGNWTTTLGTMKALEGARAHLAHIQFHSYGGAGEKESGITSRVPDLVEYFNQHDNITVDVGQVLFDRTVSMTADGPAAEYLAKLTGQKMYGGSVEVESCCGVSPIEYRNRSLVHSWQWAIGLEWLLLADDPWRIALSTDHPNGGSFVAYPQIVHLLMDREYRREALSKVHPKVREQSELRHIQREYSLGEIATVTRAAPARMLGLDRKGHLGIGADADVTVYRPDKNWSQMFALPRFVIKSGVVMCDEGDIRNQVWGKTLGVAPEFDDGFTENFRTWFDDHYSISFRNYHVRDAEVRHGETMPIRRA